MKKSSIVLATLALTASLPSIDGPAAAQALASQVTLAAKGYDQAITTAALVAATAPTSDATALLAAVNAVRYSNGAPQLALDPSLAGAATYQVQDQVNLSFSGSYAYTSRGQVTAPQMATDFGSVAAGVQEYSFGNGFFPGDTGNWTALVGDWENKDISFANMVNDPSVNVGGLGLVNVGGIVKWTLIVGYNPAATAASPQTVAVSRLYNSSNSDHFYTVSPADVQAAEQAGCSMEGVIGYAPVTAAVQVANFGFEVPALGTGFSSYAVAPTGAAWAFTGVSGVAANGSAFGNPNAPQGTQFAFVEQDGTASQPVPGFQAGQYTLSVAAALYDTAYPQSLAVQVDGQTVGTITPTGTAFAAYTVGPFSVTAGAHTLAFVGTVTGAPQHCAYIDNVQIAQATAGTAPVYRLYNPSSGEHFYTASTGDVVSAEAAGFQYESVAFQVLTSSGTGTLPLYRFYWPAAHKHFYTTSQADYTAVLTAGFTYEGIVGYLYATPPAAPPSQAVNLTGLNAALAQQAMTAAPTAGETAFLAAINAYRASLGVQPLRMESALHSAAYYKTHGTGSDAASTLAIDFGSLHSTYVASSNGTGSLFYGYTLGYYGDWTDICNLLASYDHTAQPVFSDGSYSHVGISIVDAGVKQVSPLDNLPYEVYNWTIVLGK